MTTVLPKPIPLSAFRNVQNETMSTEEIEDLSDKEPDHNEEVVEILKEDLIAKLNNLSVNPDMLRHLVEADVITGVDVMTRDEVLCGGLTSLVRFHLSKKKPPIRVLRIELDFESPSEWLAFHLTRFERSFATDAGSDEDEVNYGCNGTQINQGTWMARRNGIPIESLEDLADALLGRDGFESTRESFQDDLRRQADIESINFLVTQKVKQISYWIFENALHKCPENFNQQQLEVAIDEAIADTDFSGYEEETGED